MNMSIFRLTGIFLSLLLVSTYASASDPSPFEMVRFVNDHIEVQYGADWFRLVSIADIDEKKILEKSREEFQDLGAKRIAEDLYSVLRKFEIREPTVVKLVLSDLQNNKVITLASVKMTRENTDQRFEDLTGRTDSTLDEAMRLLLAP